MRQRNDQRSDLAPVTGSADVRVRRSADDLAHRVHISRSLTAPHWRRATIRFFFLWFAIVLIVDTAPANWAWLRPAKQFVCPILNYCGLWQGQWTLFAPTPILNNAWLSAEIYGPDGSRQRVWNSTYWANSSGWERFVGFRQMNYRNRTSAMDPRAAADYADYLARQLISPTAQAVNVPKSLSKSLSSSTVLGTSNFDAPFTAANELTASTETNHAIRPWRLVLSRNQLNIVLPDDGSLPKRDETIWISSSTNLAVREYLP